MIFNYFIINKKIYKWVDIFLNYKKIMYFEYFKLLMKEELNKGVGSIFFYF